MGLLDRPRAAALAARAGWIAAPGGRGVVPTHVPLRTMDNRQMMERYRKDLGSAPPGSSFGGGWGSGLGNLYRTGPSRLRALANSYGGTNDSVVWVFSCCSLIASTLAAYPWRFENDAGETVEDPPPDAVQLLRRPSETWTYFDLLEALTTDLELVGNAYVLKNQRNALGKPLSLHRLRPDVMRIATNPDGTIRGYVYTPQQGFSVPYDADEIIHFRYPNPLDDYYGMGTVEAISSVLDQISAEGLHVTGFFQNGARVSGVLTVPQTMTDTQFERLKASYLENYAGPANAYKLLIAEGGSDYKPVVAAPAAAGVVDLMRVGKDESLSAFGVPAPMLGGLMENANYKMEDAQHIFLRAMIPRTRRISERLTNELVYPLWGFSLKIDAHATEPQDVKIEHAQGLLKAGGKLNEAREAAGLSLLEDDYADEPLVPNSLIPAKLAGAPPRPGSSIPMEDNTEPGAPPAGAGEAAALPVPGSPGGAEAPSETARPSLPEQLADLPDAIRTPKEVSALIARSLRRERRKETAARRGFSDYDAKDAGNTGAMVALYPDPDVAESLVVDGGLEAVDLHVTLVFLGEADALADEDALREAVREWAARTPPISGEVSGVGLFTAGPEPVTYLSVDCSDLPDARQDLVAALEDAEAPVSADHGFTPHITLDYADRTAEVDAGLGGTPLRFSDVALVLGDNREDFPLAGAAKAAEPVAAGADLAADAPATATKRRSALAAVSDAFEVWGGPRKRPSGASSAPLAASEGLPEGYEPPELPRGFEALSAKGAERAQVRAWREHQARALRVGVDTFGPQLRRYFKAQRDRVLQALSQYGSGQRSARLARGATKERGDLTPEAIFDLAAENEALQASYLPALDEVGAVAADTPPSVVASVAWDLADPRVAEVRSRLAQLVTRVNDTTKAAIAEQVTTGLQRGYSIPQIANGFADEGYPGVMGVFDAASDVRAETIARTESTFALNGASALAYRDASVELVEILDGEGDEVCAAADGSIWTVDDYEANPTGHPNAVFAGAWVLPLGQARAGYRVWWSGPRIVIWTAQARRLAVSPNHPVLTDRGWVPAQEVDEGDEIVRCSAEVGAFWPAAADLDQSPARAEDLFSALGQASGARRRRSGSSPVQLHGDGRFCKGDVEVIYADGDLPAVAHVPFLQETAEEVLDGGRPEDPSFTRPGALLLRGGSVPLTSSSGMARRPARASGSQSAIGVGGTDLDARSPEPLADNAIANALFLRELARRYAVKVAPDEILVGVDTKMRRSHSDPRLAEQAVALRTTDAEKRGDLGPGEPVGVELCKVVGVRVEHYKGWAYDFETESAAYFADGHLISNCSRTGVPAPPGTTADDAVTPDE